MKNRFRGSCRAAAGAIWQTKKTGQNHIGKSSFSGWTIGFPKRIFDEYTNINSEEKFLESLLASVESQIGSDIDHTLTMGILIKLQLRARKDGHLVEFDLIVYRPNRNVLELTCVLVHERGMYHVQNNHLKKVLV